jgi:hypothetical protein
MKTSPTVNIKLISALKLLSQKEMRRFMEFSCSKYFSGERNHKRMLEELRKLHKRGFEGMSNSDILSGISKELGLSDRTIQSRMSELNSMLEKFLMNEHLNRKPHLGDELLLRELLVRDGFQLVDYVANRSAKRNDSSKLDAGLIRNLISTKFYKSTATFRRGNYKEYQKLISDLSVYRLADYLSTLFSESSEHVQQAIMGTASGKSNSELIIKSMDIDNLLSVIKKADSFLYNYVMLNYTFYRSISDLSDVSFFTKAQSYLQEITEKLTEEENDRFYFAFITYCINQISLERKEFYRVVFEIIKKKLEAGYDQELRHYNYPVNNFRDYVIIGLRVNEIQWVKDLVAKYSSMIPEKHRLEERKLALGRIAMKEEKYEEVLKLIEKIRKSNYIHYLDTTSMKLRSFFELQRYGDVVEEIKKLGKYLKNHKEIPETMHKYHISIMKDIMLLLRFKEGELDIKDLKLRLRGRDLSKTDTWVADNLIRIVD